MSNYADEKDKLRAHLDELERKHRILDQDIEKRFHNMTITDEVRRLKTQKLWLKDEIHRVNLQLVQLELQNGQ